MSSWEPPEEKPSGSSYDPGVMGKEIVDRRGFSETLRDRSRTDYVLFGMLLSIPAGFLTTILVSEFFSEFRDTASAIVREVIQLLPLFSPSR